jgi:peptidoglycan/LPS O-acetylase OafA/YrhL
MLRICLRKRLLIIYKKQPQMRSEIKYVKGFSRINEVDLLRYIAAMMVVFFHYAFRGYMGAGENQLTLMSYPALMPIAKYGFLGVDLFFMISGFVIVLSASSGDLQKFVSSRVVRLYPAFWVCCSLSLFIPLIVEGGWSWELLNTYVVNLTMLNGFVDVRSIDGVYWSLFVEIKFYLLISIILTLGLMHRIESIALVWLFVSLLLTRFPKTEMHSMLISDWSGYFIAGAAFFWVYQKGFSWLRIILVIGSYILVIRNAMHKVYFHQLEYQVDFSKQTIVVTITVFFVVFLLITTKKTGFLRRMEWRVLGAITYPLYLLHSNIGFLTYSFVGNYLFNDDF